ncbi:4-hydroxybenzoate octaprenyltransferase [Gammaproteobacteria bacterium]|jgi:4-hydroxybenzoate polyprenyltransferase|nr:4-hydroxybenzoate octaprenyltransferase [Gammaproteobacteria bacterium]
MLNQINNYSLLMRLNKPIGIYLLMWPMLWAFLISASGQPNLFYLLLFMIGVVLTRSAGCVINDFFDKDIDSQVERTKGRVLVSGEVSSSEAVLLFIALISLCILLLLMIGADILIYALISFCLLIIYPISKRLIKIPQLILGIAFGSSIPMVYIVQVGEVNASCILLYLATISWAISYDTYYAIADKLDDLKIGNKSSAILFGENDINAPYWLQMLTIILMLFVGLINNLNLFFYLALFIATLVCLYQKILVVNRKPYQCIAAFENNNYFGLIIFFGLLLNYLYE